MSNQTDENVANPINTSLPTSDTSTDVKDNIEKPLAKKNAYPTQSSCMRLTWCQKILFALGSPPNILASMLYNFMSQVYLLTVARISPSYIFALALIGRISDAITDPLMGVVLSKVSTRWGRYRPWLLISAPLLGGAFFAFFTIPQINDEKARFAYILGFLLLIMFFKTTYNIPYTSMTAVITHSSEDRDHCSAIRIAIDFIFLISASTVFSLIIKKESRKCTYAKDTINNITGIGYPIEQTFDNIFDANTQTKYMQACGIIWFVIVCCGLFGFFGTEEALKSDDVDSKDHFVVQMWSMFKRVVSHKSYLTLCLGVLCYGMAVVATSNSVNLFIVHAMGQPLNGWVYILSLPIILTSALINIPFVFFMQKCVGKKNLCLIGTFFFCVLLVVTTVLSFCFAMKQIPIYIAYVLMTLCGFPVSCYMVLPWMMLSDTIDDYELKHGFRDESMFYAVFCFLEKMGSGIAQSMLQVLLAFAKYRTHIDESCPQPAQVSTMLRINIGCLAAFYSILSMGLFCLYPISVSYRKNMDEQILKQQSKVKNDK